MLVGCLDAHPPTRCAERPRRCAGSSGTGSMLYVWPPVDFAARRDREVARRLAPLTEGLGLEQVVVSGRIAVPGSRRARRGRACASATNRAAGLTVRFTDPPTAADAAPRRLHPQADPDPPPRARLPVRAGAAAAPARAARSSSTTSTTDGRAGAGRPRAGAATGPASSSASCARRPSATPRAMTRVAAARRPDQGDGLDHRGRVPARAGGDRPRRASWTCRSSGSPCRPGPRSPWTPAARTSTGWPGCCVASSSTPRRGGEVNVVVAGINVGAQPYWNAEATMLMHTRGILVMTPDSAMVLTGKQAIDYSGGVSAEDNLGIGGYGRIMGPNGEAQYWAPDAGGGLRRAVRPLRPHLPGARRALAAPGRDQRPDRPRRARRPARRRGHRLHDGRRHLLGDCQPRPQEARSTSAP